VNQTEACNHLLSAVIVSAIKAACTSRRDGSLEAVNFLFNHADGYLILLDIDPGSFREHLIAQMKKPGQFLSINENDKRYFRRNYHFFCRVGKSLNFNTATPDQEEKP